MSARVEVGRIGSPLVDRLLAGDPAVGALYGGDPGRLAAYREKLEEVAGRFDRAARERAAAALRPTSDRARERLARFVAEGGAMVTTGQQAGLFTGPLYTLSKALTAVRLADALERRLGVIVLPVFWVASEDHDFAEVNHAWAVDGGGALRRVTVGATRAEPVPMSEMHLGGDVEAARDAFIHTVAAEGDELARVMRILAAYRPGETVAGAFREALAVLLAPYDVCLTDAADPVLKAASASILAGEAEHAAAHEAAVAERTARVEALGLTAPVLLAESATNLFYHGPAGRERLHREGAMVVAREAGERFAVAELSAAIAADPARFSPNVLLRPVVESAVFPTLAYVGGPAETGYFAQIGGLFEAFGIRPPVAFPRFGARIVTAAVRQAREELALDEEAIALPEHEILERVAAARVPPEVAAAAAALRSELVRRFAELTDAAEPLGPTLAGALGARRNRVLLEVAAAERKIIRQLKRSDASLGRDVRLVRNHLRPDGVPQERMLTVLQYLGAADDLLGEILAGIHIRFADDD